MNDFIEPMCRNSQYFEQVKEEFYAKSSEQIVQLLSETHDHLKVQFVEPLIKKLTADNKKRRLFEQVMKS